MELSLTGGRAVIEAMLSALSSLEGLRLAEPGEFTWRAFRNGKIDLSQAEGFADLIEAETEAQRRQAQRVAGGALRRECEEIRALLIEPMAILEARIDFSDNEDVERLDNTEIYNKIRLALHRVERALRNARSAERLREGFFVVIAGAPNVGKSTLLNALAGRELAITSPQAGTTRDSIEAFLDLGGYPVFLVDTAGLRESDDPVEREGIRRTRERARHADLLLWLDDTGEKQPPDFIGPHLRVRTKTDELEYEFNSEDFDVAISARTGDGLDKLLDAITALAVESMSTAEPTLLTLRRHRDAFLDAKSALSEALVDPPLELEFWADHLRQAAAALERVAGRIGVQDILGEIFGRLCIGK